MKSDEIVGAVEKLIPPSPNPSTKIKREKKNENFSNATFNKLSNAKPFRTHLQQIEPPI